MAKKRKPHRWAPSGWREYLAELDYIAKDSSAAAKLVQGRIQQAIRQVTQDPGIGRPGLVAGTRELPVPKTRILLIYLEEAETVYLLNCWHTSRNRD